MKITNICYKMSVCAVIKCGNGDYGLKKWKSIDCSIHSGYKHGIGQCLCISPFELHPFPTELKDPHGRRQWIKMINRKDEFTGKNWTPKRYSRVCSWHFPDGRPTPENPHPVLIMGYTPSHATVPARKLTTRRLEVTESVTREPSTPSTGESAVQKKYQPVDVSTANNEPCLDHCYSLPTTTCSICEGLYEQLLAEKTKNAELREIIDNMNTSRVKVVKPSPRYRYTGNIAHRFISSDEKVRQNTGLPNRDTLHSLFKHVENKVCKMRYWTGSKKNKVIGCRNFKRTPRKFGPIRKLSRKNELILVLMKLRQGVTNNFLCSIFDISLSTCSNIVNTWIRFLAKELKSLLFWPDRKAISRVLPAEMVSKYPALRCTVDCTEIFIEKPRHMELQALTWSDYKKHNTVKYLVAIAPNGMITFLSEGWGGRTSDRHIVLESGFLDLIDPGDVVLADRGFTIMSDLLMRRAKLEIPPPSSGCEQQGAAEVAKTKKVANARIHVERAIGRMKWFTILKNTVPITLVPIVDDIVSVCAALCNLLPPLVGK